MFCWTPALPQNGRAGVFLFGICFRGGCREIFKYVVKFEVKGEIAAGLRRV